MASLEIISPVLELNSLNILLHVILKQYLFASYCLNIVSEEPLDIKLDLSIVHITPNQSIDELTTQLLEVTEYGCSDYVVNMKDPRIFMAAFDKMTLLGNNRKVDKKIIILPADTETTLESLAMKESAYVANILAILKEVDSNDCEIFQLVTHEFLKLENDLPLYLDRWNACTEKFDNNIDLFPHNMKNLKGKTVRISAFQYFPFTMYDEDPSVSPTTRDGIDMRIMEEYCRWINCTLELVREEENEWGVIYKNGTSIGILGSLYEDRSDFGLGGMLFWYDLIPILDFSQSYLRSSLFCITPSPRIISSWEVPLMPFTWQAWIAIILTFVIASMGLAIARGGFKNNVLLTVFALLITQSQDLESSWRVRGITGWLLGSSLVLVSAYGAGLATIFTVPKYEPAIDYKHDLVDRNMPWGAPHDAWVYALQPSTEPVTMKLVTLFTNLPPEKLKEWSHSRKMAFIVEKITDDLIGIPDYLDDEALLDLTLMAEEMYYGNCMTLFRKSSPYKDKMSDLVGLLHQSGLLMIWETQISLKYIDFKRKQIVKLSRSKNDIGFLRPLSLKDVTGAFMVYGVGLAVSSLIFLIEILKRKLCARKGLLNRLST